MKAPAPLFAMLIAFALSGSALAAADTRAAFLKLIDRPRVPLAPEVGAPTTKADITRIDFSYATEAGKRVPGIVIKLANSTGRRPAVLVLHGTGGNKEGQVPYMIELARDGFVAVAIDGPYHGARTAAGKGSAEYVAAITRAWRDGKEHPFFFDTVWDVQRLIDYLETRDDIDASRLGLFGTSKGGIEGYLAAAVEPRIGVVVPCIAVESFRWAEENNAWQSRIGTVQPAFDAAIKDKGVRKVDAAFLHKFYSRVAPGIDREFDGPAMVPLIAPRPLLAINGELDPRTPLPGLNLCVDATRAAYKAAGAEEKFVLHIQPNTAHKVLPESQALAREWFVKWLKP